MLFFFKIVSLSVCVFLFVAGITSGAVCLVFKYSPKRTARSSAKLSSTRHKKNVTTYEFRPLERGVRRTGFIKNLTNAKYLYSVEGRSYMIGDNYIGTPRQTPLSVPVVYLRRFPRFAYIDTLESIGIVHYGIHALVCLGISIAFFYLGIII